MSISFGSSVPKDPSGKIYNLKSGTSRAKGGEHLVLRTSGAKMISSIRLAGHSASRSGKVLIRNAVAFNGNAPVALEGLYVFAKVTGGKPENYQKLVMLPDSTFVEVNPNQAFNRLDLTVEGFSNNDASLLLQVTYAGELRAEEFLVSRTSNSETAGAYVNESGYAKFTEAQLKSVMTIGSEPAPADLTGKTFLCTSYSKLEPARVDFKKRAYYSGPAGELLSKSEGEGQGLLWAHVADGLALAIDNRNGCGQYFTYNVVRATGEGNLVSEIVLDLDAYITLCTGAGYDTSGTRELLNYSTYPSLLGSKYVVGNYEFCKQTAN